MLQETVWISRVLTEGGVQNISTILPAIVIPSIMAKHVQVSITPLTFYIRVTKSYFSFFSFLQ